MRGEIAGPGYVLHARPYRETSLLLELFMRDGGRVGAVARGLRSARAQPLRAALQPLQPLQLTLRGGTDLAQLRSAEPTAPPLVLHGATLLAGFYLNELLVRLLPRGEAVPALFWRYAAGLGAIEQGADLGWQLRCFERDLLQAIGYGLVLDCDAQGEPIIAAQRYAYRPDLGLVPCPATEPAAALGADLQALAEDDPGRVAEPAALRRLLRQALQPHLGGRTLHSWGLLAQLRGSH